MEEKDHKVQIRLRVREIAEAKNWDIHGLMHATGLPLSILEVLWNHPTQDQNIEIMVVIALALDVKLGDLVEITMRDKDKEI